MNLTDTTNKIKELSKNSSGQIESKIKFKLNDGCIFIDDTINPTIINNEDIVKFDYLESLNSSHLFVLMYPVKESTLDRLNKVIEETNSITYIPWSL